MAKVRGSTRPRYHNNNHRVRVRVVKLMMRKPIDVQQRKLCEYMRGEWVRSIHLRLGQERPDQLLIVVRLKVIFWREVLLCCFFVVAIVMPCLSSLLLCGALIKSCFNSFDLFCNYPIMYANFFFIIDSR